MRDPDVNEIRAVLSVASSARRRRFLRDANPAGRSRRLARERGNVEKHLALHLQAGSGSTEVPKALAGLRHASQEHKAAAVKSSDATMQGLRAGIAAWRGTKERLASYARERLAPELNFNFVVIERPLFVLPSNDVVIVSELLAPWDNVVKCNAEWDTPYPDNGVDGLSYVFVWTNPNDRWVVINAESYLAVNGLCEMFVGPDDFGVIGFNAFLEVLQYWNNPPTYPASEDEQVTSVFDITADGGWPFGLGDYATASIGGTYDVRYDALSVPPHGTVVFEVELGGYHYVEGGSISLDLASGGFQTMCPAVVLAIVG